MKRLFLSVMALLISVALYSQLSSNDNARYWNVWQYKAKEGKTQDFMEAAAEKTAKFNATVETGITTYRIETGRRAGTFVRISGPLKSADFDVDRSAEGKYWQENVAKYVGQNLGLQRWNQLNDATMNFTPGEGKPSNYFEQTFYEVKQGKVGDFRRFQYRVVENLKKRNMPVKRAMFRLISGGNTNMFVVVNFFDTYKQDPAPSNESRWEDDYNELFGRGSWDRDMESYRASFESWGVMKETLRLIPQMSTGLME